jgi:hypothetical protein
MRYHEEAWPDAIYGPELGEFGDARSNIVSGLAVILGKDKAESIMRSFEDLIRSRAEEGAKKAIPTIKAEVKKTVLPLVVGAAAVGVLGVLFGVIALKRTRRRS